MQILQTLQLQLLCRRRRLLHSPFVRALIRPSNTDFDVSSLLSPRFLCYISEHWINPGSIHGSIPPTMAESSSSLISNYEWNTKLKLLVKTNRIQDARRLFDTMPVKDVASWTILISGYVSTSLPYQALLLFSRMFNISSSSVKPDTFVISVTLKACGLSSPVHVRRKTGQSVHGYTVKCGLNRSSVFVSSALLDMYSKAGLLSSAIQMFDEMPSRNVVTWTAAITALARGGCSREAIQYFSEMYISSVPCDSHTFAITLKACADSGHFLHGKEIHTHAVKNGFDMVPFVANALSTLYSKFGKIELSIRLFERMRRPDVVSWTTMISSLSQMGREDQAMHEFTKMLRYQQKDSRPNEYTFAAIISASTSLGQVSLGEQLHASSIRFGVAQSLSTSNATITMYYRFARLASATMLFHETTAKDAISWSAIISGHSQEGNMEDAFTLFSRMMESGIEVNEYVLASLLSMCAQIAILELGRQVHGNAIVTGLDVDSMVSSTLVNMYSKCGCIEEAQQIFSNQGYENVVSMTSMINGYADHGFSLEAICLFERMRSRSDLKPDSVTFISVLNACSHSGLIDLGFTYFDLMQTIYGIVPEREHFGCMVNLLCSAGRLSDAENMIEKMPFEPDDVVWSAMLQASRIHGNAECGRRAAEKILALHSNCAGTLTTLSNLYASKGRWNDAANVRILMRSKGVRKEPGWSWITLGENTSVFVAGDLKHFKSKEIYDMLCLFSPKAKMTMESLVGIVD